MRNKLVILSFLSLLSVPSQAAKKTKAKAAAAAAGEIFKVDLATSVVNWKGAKVTGAHNGKIKMKEGTLEVSGNEIKGGMLTFDMTSLVCEDLTDAKYNEKLIGHLKSDDFFGVEKNPTATFKITSVKSVNAAENSFEVTGDLMIKGKSNALTFPAKIDNKDGVMSAVATAKVDRTKYGIKYGSGKFFENLGDKMIQDDFEISFDLSAKK